MRDRERVGVLDLREWHDIQGLSLDVLLFLPLCSWPPTKETKAAPEFNFVLKDWKALRD